MIYFTYTRPNLLFSRTTTAKFHSICMNNFAEDLDVKHLWLAENKIQTDDQHQVMAILHMDFGQVR